MSCEYVCPHNISLKKIVLDIVGMADQYYCTDCSMVFATFNNVEDSVNFHKRPTFVKTWNDVLGPVQFTTNDSGANVGVYQRFTNADYSYNANASITLVGGFQYPVSVGEVTNGRYAVLRVRYADIKYLELDLWTGKEFVKNLPSTSMSAFANINISAVPQGEWVNLVVDLSKFTPHNNVYDITSTDVYTYMRAILCPTFTSADGYIDIDYFAICNDMAEVDRCLSYSYGDYYGDYYMYSGTKFKRVANSHHFYSASGDLKRDCVYCGWRCPHTDYTVKYHTSSKLHSTYKMCDFCPWDFDWVREPHYFTDNTVKCTDEHCTFTCNHFFVNSVCSKCGWNCEHRFERGHIKCVSCGSIVTISQSENVENGFINLIGSIYDGQATIFFSMLDYDIWGVNLAGFIISLISLGIAIFVLKKVK